jgi:putative ABC transport system substrate-binding protein
VQFNHPHRRDCLLLLGGAAAAAVPLAAHAQQKLRVVGVLNSASPAALKSMLSHFQGGLGDTGFVENRNVRFEYRWAEGVYDRLPGMAADLAQRRVAAIFATGDSGWAARDATGTIPIVFANGSDPVEAGLVDNLSRPSANVTGVSWTSNPLVPKRLELLRDLVPGMAVVGALINPRNPSAGIDARALRVGASALGLRLELQNAISPDDLVRAFAAFAQRKAGAIVVGADSFFTTRRSEITALAARYALPASYSVREYAAQGGLMSYSPRREEVFRLAGTYVGRILKGTKPGDLPVQLPTKFELVINLRTARELGLNVPPNVLTLADAVIE